MRRRIGGLLLATALPLAGGSARAEDWTSFGLTAGQGRHAGERSGAEFRSAWRLRLPADPVPVRDAILSSPAVADGFVVFGTMTHDVRAARAEDGKEVWRFDTGGAIQAAPAVRRGRVIVPVGDDHLYALRLADGRVAWKAPLGGSTISSPTLFRDGHGEAIAIATGTPHRALVRVNAETGAVVWRTAEGVVVGSSDAAVAVGEGVIVLATTGGVYQGFDAGTGALRWTYETGEPVFRAAPLVVGTTVFIAPGASGPKLHAIDLATGKTRQGWPVEVKLPADEEAAAGTFLYEDQIFSSPVSVGPNLVLQVRVHAFRDTDKDKKGDLFVARELLVGVDRETGGGRFVVPLGRKVADRYDGLPALGVTPTPAIYDSLGGEPLVAAASSVAPTVTVLTGAGKTLWSGTLAAPTRSSPAFANGQLLVGTDAGAVDAFVSLTNRAPAAPEIKGEALKLPRAGGNLQWKGQERGGEKLTYLVRIDSDGEVLEDWAQEIVSVPGATHVPVPRALPRDVAYHFAVRARDAHGALSGWSALQAFDLGVPPQSSTGSPAVVSVAELVARAEAGETVAIPPGVHRLEEAITLPPGVSLAGAGPQRTVLDARGLGAALVVSGDGDRRVIRGLTITGAEVGVDVRDGQVELRNLVVRANSRAGVVVGAAGDALVANVTFAKNGIAVEAHGEATVKNSILLGNETGLAARAGAKLFSRYNDLFENRAAYEGLSADPTDLSREVLFEDREAEDFRVKAAQPTTDSGDPGDPFAEEPAPHGNRINLGAFGNTSEAETSAPPASPPVAARRASGCAFGGAPARGEGLLAAFAAAAALAVVHRRRAGRGHPLA